MTYKKLLKKVAKEYGTTPEEVDREMREAIKAAGLNSRAAKMRLFFINTIHYCCAWNAAARVNTVSGNTQTN